MSGRERIAAIVRALRAKTVENGCTEDEAIAAAEKLAEILARHNMTVDEAELRSSPFERHREQHNDLVGQRLWKVAAGISELTGATYWTSAVDGGKEINFFGFEHEVAVASYLLEVCAGAMRRAKRQIAKHHALMRPTLRLAKVVAFLDGLAQRLYERLVALKPADPIAAGKGLVVIRDQLIKAALKDEGIELQTGRERSRSVDEDYMRGMAAGDRVSLNRGLTGGGQSMGLLR